LVLPPLDILGHELLDQFLGLVPVIQTVVALEPILVVSDVETYGIDLQLSCFSPLLVHNYIFHQVLELCLFARPSGIVNAELEEVLFLLFDCLLNGHLQIVPLVGYLVQLHQHELVLVKKGIKHFIFVLHWQIILL
jgi:hypothetical protein